MPNLSPNCNDRAFFFFYLNQSEDVNMLKINEMNNVFSIFQGAGRMIPGGATLVFQVEMVAFL